VYQQLDLWSALAEDPPCETAAGGDNERVPEGWLTTAQVAERLGLKQQQVRNMLRANRFPNAEQVNPRLWLIPESDLEGVKLPKKGRPPKKRRRRRPPE